MVEFRCKVNSDVPGSVCKSLLDKLSASVFANVSAMSPRIIDICWRNKILGEFRYVSVLAGHGVRNLQERQLIERTE